VHGLEQQLHSRENEVQRLRERIDDDDAIKESLRERMTQLNDELGHLQCGGEEAALKQKMQQRIVEELSSCVAELQVNTTNFYNFLGQIRDQADQDNSS
jgi:predicted  nucleic acid-binding Zn-ribbon protein